MFLILILFVSPLFAATLGYDQASGMLVGFDLSLADDPSKPSDYNNSDSYWAYPNQFIGRLAYSGEPTNLTFTNSGPTSDATNDWLYFTYMTDGVSRVDLWRAFFLVAKIRVLKHESSTHEDYGNGKNKRVQTYGASFDIPGAGPSSELVAYDEEGYNTEGKRKVRSNNHPEYKYRYQYQSVWVDLTVIRRKQTKPVPLLIGFYETKFLVTAETGPTCDLHLVGENNPDGPSDFLFTVINVAPSSFPFEDIRTRNSVQDSLKVAEISYFSSLDPANLEFSSSPDGSAIDFRLSSDSFSFPYNVAFDCNTPELSPQSINSTTIRFDSQFTSVPSPIDTNVTNAYVIEGDLCIYLQQSVTPRSGMYSSNIYCILTQGN